MKIYIIRHGETPANAAGMLQGWSDFPLNENGELLAGITGSNLQGIRFDLAYSSPLIRAEQTARIVLDSSGNKDTQIITDDRIKEICFGDWEGKKFRGGENELPAEKLRTFFTDPFEFVQSPGGEKVTDLCRRTQDFLKDIAGRQELDEKNILVATHGCALRAMLNFLYDDPSDFWHGHVPYNCVVNIVDASDGVITLEEEDRIFYDSSFCIDRYKKC